MDPLSRIRERLAPQSMPVDPSQRPNHAGGYTFVTTPEQQVRRFLMLGTTGGTFHVRERQLTQQNAQAVLDMARDDHATLVRTIVEVSTSGAAPRQNPTLFALAIAASHGTDAERAAALAVLPQVARTGTHLFVFAGYVEQFRGWGRGLRRAVASWYVEREVDQLAFQAVKYRQRGGWSHRDLLRLSHPVATEPSRRALFDWIVRGAVGEDTPRLVEGFIRAQEPGADVAGLVREYRLGWEMLPDEALGRIDVWDALLDTGVPQTALMRQLPRLTRLGMLPPVGGRTQEVAARLQDAERLRAARVHPVAALVAHRTYSSGRSLRGSAEWTPTPAITDALDAAFYAAFGAVQPAGRRTLLALDVSGSMGMSVCGDTGLTPREASAALAMVQLATEPDSFAMGFSHQFVRLDLLPRQRLGEAIRAVGNLPFGATDCSLPMRWAQRHGVAVDTFAVYTDNETWAGPEHAHRALESYRQHTGIPARMVVVGMSATECSIADPSDPGMLDVAGFDAGVPQLIAGFSRGNV